MSKRSASILVVLLAACAPGRGGPGGGGDDSPAGDGDLDVDSDADADGDGGDADADGDRDRDRPSDPVDCPGMVVPTGDIGEASRVPLGGGDGPFTLRWWVELDVVGGDMDAAKMIPLAADLDGDGDLDLALNPRKMPATVVFEGVGDGSFLLPPHTLPTEMFATGWGGDLGDVDSDGSVDVVVGDHGTGAHAWRNGGAMSFSAIDAGLPQGTYSGAGLADLSGDGALDVIFGADQFGSGFSLSLGDGSGGWAVQAAAGLPAFGGGGPKNVGYFAFADYDEDGDNDIFGFGMGIAAYVYRNEGGLSFSEAARLGTEFGTIGNPVQGSVADVDGDGTLDIAVGGQVSFGSGGAWGATTRVLDDALIAHFADMDGDCAIDLVTSSTTSGLHLWSGDGDGAFAEADVALPGADRFPQSLRPHTEGATLVLGVAYGIEVTDVDGNGNLDIVRTYQAEEEGGSDGGGFGGMTDASMHNIVEVWVR